MSYFPIFIKSESKRCVVVGAGSVAERKIKVLHENNFLIKVIAQEYSKEFEKYLMDNNIEYLKKGIEKSDILGADMVVMATNNREVNRETAIYCREHNILVNVADSKELSTFIFPALVKRKNVVVGISTGGDSPAFSAYIRKIIDSHIPEYYGDIADTLSAVRKKVINIADNSVKKKQIFNKLIDELVKAKGKKSMADIDKIIEESGNMMDKKKIKAGTRKSNLALAQTYLVHDAIKDRCNVDSEIIKISTKGDKILDRPLLSFGGKGVFISEFESMLINKEVDIAVHSAKDMPNELADNLIIGAVLKREDERDVLVTLKGKKYAKEDKFVIGTGSLRRKTQVALIYMNAEFKDLRGNVNTRLNKLKSGEYDAIVLAAAGLKRLDIDEDEYEFTFLSCDECIPAAGQGIIAVESRDEEDIKNILSEINDEESAIKLATERKVLECLNASCNEPVGVHSYIEDGKIYLKICIMSEHGLVRLSDSDIVDNNIALAIRAGNNIKKIH